MKVITGEATGEITEKKSRFIATCVPVTSEEEARDFVASIKKKYYDARHNCYAWCIGENNENTKSSDDGEPSGTAGRPILDVLLHSGIGNICMVVTRYFGGVLLGTGGLVRAYQGAAQEALKNAATKEEISGLAMTVETDYNGYGRINYYLENERIPVLSSEFTDRVFLTVFVTPGQRDHVSRQITELTNGIANISVADDEVICYNQDS